MSLRRLLADVFGPHTAYEDLATASVNLCLLDVSPVPHPCERPPRPSRVAERQVCRRLAGEWRRAG